MVWGMASPPSPFAQWLETLNAVASPFVFSQMLEKFNKEVVAKEVEKEKPKEPVYNKDEFFDLLSCEALERSGEDVMPCAANACRCMLWWLRHVVIAIVCAVFAHDS